MTDERYSELMGSDDIELTKEELEEGWHFCLEWDALLIGPGMEDMLRPCQCLPDEHKVYNFKKKETNEPTNTNKDTTSQENNPL